MIPAKELRFGNIIKRVDGVVTKVSEIKERTVATQATGHLPLSDFEPLPLTEDWLVNFGFKEIYNYYIHRRKGFCLGDIIIEVSGGKVIFNWNGHDLELLFVHQLQNLYFTLTQKELSAKSPPKP